MDYGLTEEQCAIRDLARSIADKEIRPVAAEYDRTAEFPWPIVRKMAEADLFGVFVDDAYGGIAGDARTMNMVLVTEELSKACGGIALAFAGSALGALPIILSGSEAQKQRFLPAVASGARLAAFALTEPQAGSDAGGIRTTAVRDGDHYVLNGTKLWITGGGEAEIYTVVVMTNPAKGPRGSSVLIVEKDTPGFSFGKKEDKMGIRASATRELIFEDCRVPVENLVGKEGTGFIVAMRTFDASRPGVAAQAVGIAHGALDLAVDYAITRRQFGAPVSSFQGLRFLLADMAMKVEAARALVYATARYVDSNPKVRPTIYSAMSKCFAGDMAMEVTTDAVQVFGGYGYMRDYPIEKYMRDAKITQIYEGTNQIQREEISKILIGEHVAGHGRAT
ncbi:MAG: acyl-CoA dehydrogenase family protein [Gemmatimonadota bacterium]|nr:acyl-CoA dehydrogenase family protein [Gemmatimonadota bacterium]MDH5199223.1 acyl-CoA dehydrogenase family protein [Gemmatimonadota bacterium]